MSCPFYFRDSVGSNTATQTSAKRIQTRSTSYFSHKDQRKQKLDKTPVTHKNYDKQKRYHLDLTESLDAIDDSSVGREKAGRLKHAVSSLSEYDMRLDVFLQSKSCILGNKLTARLFLSRPVDNL